MYRFDQGMDELTRAAVKIGEALREIHVTGAYRLESCSSVFEWAERRKCSASMARMLEELCDGMTISPELEKGVKEQRIPLQSAAALTKVLENPSLVRPGEDWIGLAQTATTRDVTQAVRQRVAEEKAGKPTVTWTFFLTHQSTEDFNKARRLASREKGQALSPEQTLDHVVGFYLDEKDPDRVKPGARRMPDTTGAGRGDWSAEVARGILARTGGKCLVATCDNDIFIDKAHVTARRKGGGFEKGLPLCQPHHQDYDDGRLRNVGTFEDPILVTLDGKVVYSRRRRPLVPPGAGPPSVGPPGPAPPDSKAKTRKKPP